MKNFTLNIIFGGFFLLIFVGCTRTVSVQLKSAVEMLPSPEFIATGANEGNVPEYSLIKVYHEETGCTVPNCPLIWHARVSPKRSPRVFRYGFLPGVGSTTIVAAKDLVPGEKYYLVLGFGLEDAGGIEGSVRFSVTDIGEVVVVDK